MRRKKMGQLLGRLDLQWAQLQMMMNKVGSVLCVREFDMLVRESESKAKMVVDVGEENVKMVVVV
ncbi:hypothetical protein BVRB_2g035790 [Beta vulgaris subsp. vulgaris]|nr:hypothetical protein BVRB_2g035790 [Beta vulgaris subsp. vulgaris]